MTSTITTNRNTLVKNPTAELLNENVRIYLRVQSAFDECSEEIQDVVRDMADIFNSPESTEEEKNGALYTMVEAIFPSLATTVLETCEDIRKKPKPQEYNNRLKSQEEYFANKVREVMEGKNMTQEQLAERIGISQSAICNMLNRKCRPQKRTIEKVAGALDVEISDPWMDFNVDGSSNAP